MNYNEFMKNVEEFVFAESQPEKADIIFVPGNGFPDMAEKAASLYREGYAPYILPSGRYSITLGKFAGVQSKKEIYGGDYETEWEFLKNVLLKNGVPEEAILREDQATFTYENAIFSRQVTDLHKIQCEKSDSVLQNLPCQKIIDVLSAFISGDGNYGMSGLPGWNYQGELERNRNWCGGCYRRNRQDCQAVLFNAGKSVR
ncbi:MAG: YdcF family protein [Ruminococcus sp.]